MAPSTGAGFCASALSSTVRCPRRCGRSGTGGMRRHRDRGAIAVHSCSARGADGVLQPGRRMGGLRRLRCRRPGSRTERRTVRPDLGASRLRRPGWADGDTRGVPDRGGRRSDRIGPGQPRRAGGIGTVHRARRGGYRSDRAIRHRRIRSARYRFVRTSGSLPHRRGDRCRSRRRRRRPQSGRDRSFREAQPRIRPAVRRTHRRGAACARRHSRCGA